MRRQRSWRSQRGRGASWRRTSSPLAAASSGTASGPAPSAPAPCPPALPPRAALSATVEQRQRLANCAQPLSLSLSRTSPAP
eukprot:3037368-Rhodomonas_salina.1